MLCLTHGAAGWCCRGCEESIAQFVAAASEFNKEILALLEPVIGKEAAQDFFLKPVRSYPPPAAHLLRGAPMLLMTSNFWGYNRIDKKLMGAIMKDFGFR